MTLTDTNDYRRLLLENRPLLDLRAPAEFARGAFPGASSLPLMNDEERAQVGTCYKQQGQEAAIALGHGLVSGAVREQRLDAWCAFARQHPDGYLYCFRGGLRSQIVQRWMSEAGQPLPRIEGGYKAMRQFLLESLEHSAAALDVIVVAGPTGAGKTKLLPRLPRAVDLEGLANHRGSSFGALLEPQPTTINFENALAIALLRLEAESGPVFLEDESRLIGRLALPPAVHQRIRAAPYVELQLSFAQRVEGVIEDYVIDLGRRYQALAGEEGSAQHEQRLLQDLERIQRRLGAERHQQVRAAMQEAFAAQRGGAGLEGHREWVTVLLRDYYDPMYEYGMSRRASRCLFRGPPDAICEWASQRSSTA